MSKYWNKKEKIILLCIILAGAFFRIWGLSFGLPNLLYFDEGYEIHKVFNLATSNSDDYSKTGKGVFFYILFFVYSLKFFLLKLISPGITVTNFITSYYEIPGNFYLLGRAVNVIFGVISIYIIARIAEEQYGNNSGIFAAAILAFSPLHSENCHYIIVDILLIVNILLFFHFLFQINRKNGETLIDFLGVYTFLGVAICTKLTGVILFVPFFVFLFSEFTKKKWSVLKKFLLMFPVFITVVYILSPGLVTGVTTHLTGIEKLYLKREEIVQPVERLTGFTRLPPLLFYAKELYINSGLPLFIFFISGVFFTLFNCKLTDFLLLSFVVPYSVILLVPKGADVVFSRYLLPMIVILALFTSRFFSEIFKKIKQKPGSLIFLICVATGIFILPVKNIVIQDYVFSQNDTRNLLREWLYENLKSGDKVLVDFQKLSYPGQDPGFSWQLQKTGFNFVTISNFSEWSEIKKFRKSGIKFVVLRPDIYSDVLLENFPDKTKAQNMKTFYQFIKSANDNFTAIAGFGFGKKLISGPRLEVFKFSDS